MRDITEVTATVKKPSTGTVHVLALRQWDLENGSLVTECHARIPVGTPTSVAALQPVSCRSCAKVQAVGPTGEHRYYKSTVENYYKPGLDAAKASPLYDV